MRESKVMMILMLFTSIHCNSSMNDLEKNADGRSTKRHSVKHCDSTHKTRAIVACTVIIAMSPSPTSCSLLFRQECEFCELSFVPTGPPLFHALT